MSAKLIRIYWGAEWKAHDTITVFATRQTRSKRFWPGTHHATTVSVVNPPLVHLYRDNFVNFKVEARGMPAHAGFTISLKPVKIGVFRPKAESYRVDYANFMLSLSHQPEDISYDFIFTLYSSSGQVGETVKRAFPWPSRKPLCLHLLHPPPQSTWPLHKIPTLHWTLL